MSQFDPLFRKASEATRRAMRQQFRRSEAGRLLSEIERARRAPGNSGRKVGAVIKKYQRLGGARALESMMGMPLRTITRGIQRYSKDRVSRKLLGAFLDQLGPAGKILKAISTGGPKAAERELAAARGLLEAFGYKVLGPELTAKDLDEGTREIVGFLENLGYTVLPPGDEVPPEFLEARAEEQARQQRAGRQSQPQTQDVPMSRGPAKRFAADHPIVTGEMVPVRSSNVHSIGYDASGAYLYVRFLQADPILSARQADLERKGPGPLYRYSSVEPEQFLAFLAAPSAGEWIWDHLRVRGTASGHRKDYELVGVMHDYVPRKATLMADGREWFLQRRIRTTGGRWLTSSRKTEPVPASYYQQFGRPNRGEADRGEPNRGEPNRGNG